MDDIITFEDPNEVPNFIKVIGIGGGGGNAVTHMYTEGIKGVDFIICNTDYQALAKSPVPNKISIGKLGAGNNPEVAREAAEAASEEIHKAIGEDTKMLFITAGMGGGTGTGAAPIVSKIAHDMGMLTVGIVTTPFSLEGKRRKDQAEEGIREMKKYVDAYIIISNDKLREEFGNMKLSEAFRKADDVLKTAAKGIAELVTVTGHVNVDFRDVDAVMRGSGKAIMGSAVAEGEDRADRAIREALESPLLTESDLTGAKNILLYIHSGTTEVTLDEVNDMLDYIQQSTGHVSDIIWGNGRNDALGEAISVTVIASGFPDTEDQQPVTHVMYTNASPELNERKNEEPKVEEKEEPKVEEKEEPKVEEKVEEKPEIKIVTHNETVESASKEVQTPERIIHHLVEEEKNEENDDELTTNEQPAATNPLPDSNDRTQNDNVFQSATPSIKKYDNPFVNNNDDDDFGLKKFDQTQQRQPSAMVQTQVKTIAKTIIDPNEEMRRKRLNGLSDAVHSMSSFEYYESVPAYKRLGLEIGNNTSNEELSNYSAGKDELTYGENSYLNAKVD